MRLSREPVARATATAQLDNRGYQEHELERHTLPPDSPRRPTRAPQYPPRTLKAGDARCSQTAAASRYAIRPSLRQRPHSSRRESRFQPAHHPTTAVTTHPDSQPTDRLSLCWVAAGPDEPERRRQHGAYDARRYAAATPPPRARRKARKRRRRTHPSGGGPADSPGPTEALQFIPPRADEMSVDH